MTITPGSLHPDGTFAAFDLPSAKGVPDRTETPNTLSRKDNPGRQEK
jgi:hypothetical protein